MPIGMIFWVLMIIWFIFGFWWHWPKNPNEPPWPMCGHFLIFVLFFLLGWKVFGFVVTP